MKRENKLNYFSKGASSDIIKSIEKSSGNMYPNVKTWNPIDGECPHYCKYCAVKKLFNRKLPGAIKKYSGELRLNEKEANRNLGKENTWFICGVGNDLFASGVEFGWIDTIIANCMKYPQNTYMLQTKNTKNMYNYFKGKYIPDNFTLGTTIETDINSLMFKYNGCDFPFNRVEWLRLIKHKHKYITIEPIMKFTKFFLPLIEFVKPELIYIGANSYSKINLPEPTKEEVLQLISELNKVYVVEQKNNLKRLLK